MNHTKLKWLRYMLVAVLLLSGAVIYVYREYNRKEPGTLSLKPDFTLSAIELFNAFSQNEKEANLRYLDKVIEVNGSLKQWDVSEEGALTIVLGVSDKMSSVRCNMDSTQVAGMVKIPEGTSVMVKGICTGYTADELIGSDVFLKRCVFSQ